jgi:hypothetical protein
MTKEKHNLRLMSDAELHDWFKRQKPGSDEYYAGEEESMRRVAIIESRIEKAEEPSRKRELTAIALAMIAIVAIIVFTIMSY